MVDAAISGMHLAASEATIHGMELDHRRNVVLMTGTLLWDEDKCEYLLKDGDDVNGNQCASITCEDGSFVHLSLGTNIESIEELHATITRTTNSTLSIAVVCRQTIQKQHESGSALMRGIQTKCRVVVTHNPVPVATDTFTTMIRTASLTFPVPEIGQEKRVLIAGPPQAL